MRPINSEILASNRAVAIGFSRPDPTKEIQEPFTFFFHSDFISKFHHFGKINFLNALVQGLE